MSRLPPIGVPANGDGGARRAGRRGRGATPPAPPGGLVILAIVQELVARLGVVTGQGLSDLIRDRFGVRWTVFAMVVLLVANLANTVAEFAGAAAALEIFGIP